MFILDKISHLIGHRSDAVSTDMSVDFGAEFLLKI